MLVAAGAVDLLTFDLVLLIQVWFVDKGNLLCEFDLFGLELIVCLAVAVGSHATGVYDSRSGLDALTTQGEVREAVRCRFGYVRDFRGFIWLLGLIGWIMALDTAPFIVFAPFPKFITLLYNAGIGENVAVATDKLGLGDIRLGKLELRPRLLISPQSGAD